MTAISMFDGLGTVEHGLDEDWRYRGSCTSFVEPDLLWFAKSVADRRDAIYICSECPVRVECLAEALKNHERNGVWGGVDMEEPRRASRAAYVRMGRPVKKVKDRVSR